jgi:tetratricopeptide (TPR) repeat protein
MSTPLEQAEQARLDLEELQAQVASGEIDAETGARLRATYQREIELAEARSERPPAAGQSRSRTRVAAGALVLLTAIALTAVVLSQTLEPDPDRALQGIAATGTFEPGDYSDETLEAVVAAYSDDPTVAGQLPYMRFALAERYFERNDFQRAFTHYEAILQRDPAPDLFASTMTRIAWITFIGNGEVDLSLQVIDRAIEAMPTSTEALYVKGQILWCGAGDAGSAAVLFELVLTSDQLDPVTRAQVERDLTAAAAGEPCT